MGLQRGVGLAQLVCSQLLELRLLLLARLVVLVIQLEMIPLHEAPGFFQVIHLMPEGVAEPNCPGKERG